MLGLDRSEPSGVGAAPTTTGPTTTGSCSDEVCITCSDQALALPVVELLEGDLALVEVGGRLERVSVALVEAEVGDTVLVHAGEAIASTRPGRSPDAGQEPG